MIGNMLINRITAYLAMAGGFIVTLLFAILKIRKGGADAQKLKTEQQTNEQIIAVQKRIHEAGYISNDDVRDSLRKGDF
jgi:hypothetical protein